MKELKLFGMRMRELRTSRKLSQEQLAEKVGISPKYMSRIETGSQFPSFGIITKLADALQVEVKDFFEFTHEAGNIMELKKIIKNLLKELEDDKDKLKVTVKFLRALAR